MLGSSQEGKLPFCSAGAGSRCSLNGNLDKFVDILGAAAAAAILLEPELGLKLAGHHKSGLSGFSHVSFGDSFAKAEVQDSTP